MTEEDFVLLKIIALPSSRPKRVSTINSHYDVNDAYAQSITFDFLEF